MFKTFALMLSLMFAGLAQAEEQESEVLDFPSSNVAYNKVLKYMQNRVSAIKVQLFAGGDIDQVPPPASATPVPNPPVNEE